ncbi:phospholipid-binding protein MlaC [Neisseria sp. 23W00296]|uniref:MlaC/ttg2D family ABC transporter substrate-binding protein n=1 Tax=unclassified Neisseria TaxID=2623750 RepID=UPI0002A3E6A9|nr:MULTISPECIES: ABC transporter substrate-binding protein [unclassified Neisseria]ASP17320.1 transporter [Neisseria sp. KEM232]EKY04139.1 toluene tolerance protein Ttg2D [Neisseria sp. oral taxon 020 str. F0370]
MKTTLYTAAIIAAAVGSAHATPQQAVAQVRENAAQVLTILKKANGSNDAAVRKEAENYALPYFDFQRMTAQAVGQPWTQATPAQKQALAKEFQTLLIRTYSGTMLKFKNSTVDVKANPVVNKGGKEIVIRTEISQSGGKPVNMDFTTYQSGGKYRVYNVAVEGASLVTVYRNQFGETIKNKGFDGLIQDLKTKNGGK